MSEALPHLTPILAELCEASVEFIIVGGAAAVLHGAPVTTVDLDIVHRRSEENIARLMAVLQKLDAYARFDLAKRRLPPKPKDLAGEGHVNLQTRFGPLDVLCEVTGKQGYDELLPHTDEIRSGGFILRILDLPTLIAVKAATGRPKDRLVLPVLIATLEERQKRNQ